MFQATNSAPSSSSFVNIIDLKGGKVSFSLEDNNNQINTTESRVKEKQRGIEKGRERERKREREREREREESSGERHDTRESGREKKKI